MSKLNFHFGILPLFTVFIGISFLKKIKTSVNDFKGHLVYAPMYLVHLGVHFDRLSYNS